MADDTSRGFTPSNAQKGAFLMALGRQMFMNDLSAGAALDGASNEDMIKDMHGRVPVHVAEQMLKLGHDELMEAIDGSF